MNIIPNLRIAPKCETCRYLNEQLKKHKLKPRILRCEKYDRYIEADWVCDDWKIRIKK